MRSRGCLVTVAVGVAWVIAFADERVVAAAVPLAPLLSPSSLRAVDGHYDPAAGYAAPAVSSDEGAPGTREREGIFGPLRLGPVASVSFPRPVSVALVGTIGRTVGVGIEYSALPSVTLDDVSVHAWAISGEGRYYIAASPVFVGAAFGYQALSGTAMFQGVPGQGEATTVFVTPRLGLFWTTDSGFSFGCDLGVQLPLSSSLTVTPSYATDVVASNDVLTTLTRRPLPELHLVRLGWLF